MNEFLEQFLIESRQLVDEATDDLLALEQHPGDAARLDSAFRAFHTLKGGAGIVEFEAMARALHAAEDVLARVRAGEQAVTSALISDCLTCLDQVVQWLDAIEASGEIPVEVTAQTQAIVDRFAPPADSEPLPGAWLDGVRARHPKAVAEARCAFRYAPPADAFYRGQDPFALASGLDGLLSLDLQLTGPDAPLEAADPFACRLVLLGLTEATAERASAHFGTEADHLHLLPLNSVRDARLSPQGRTLLDAQVALLTVRAPEGFSGRMASAARTVANVLKALALTAEAEAFQRLAGPRLAAADAPGLARLIEQAAAGDLDFSPAEDAEIDATSQARPEAVQSLRVDVARVDALVALTGELTVAKNAVGHALEMSQDGTDPARLTAFLKDQHGLLNRLTAELQRTVLNLRVLPIRHVFQRFPRVVRELSASVGRPARLITEGEDTEADKAVVEALFEPLVHLVRNAIDHGLESPERRAELGKPATATLRLSAAREGEHVVIALADDGRGVDLERVRRVALERRVATAEALADMADAQVLDLIFAPGFSTAETVGALSGRGVGMDAVRSAIERMGGRVVMESEAGVGARVRLTLPFTVVMTRVITAEAGGQVFGIPLDAVIETVRLPAERIAPIGGARAVVLRDRTVPVIDLSDAVGSPQGARAIGEVQLVVVELAGQLGAIAVDRVGETVDVMLKPLTGLLAGTPGVAGTTLLGDGRVLLVLDLQELL